MREPTDTDATIERLAHLRHVSKRLQRFSRLDWNRIQREDPVHAHEMWRYYLETCDEARQLLAEMKRRGETGSGNTPRKPKDETDIAAWMHQRAEQIRARGLTFMRAGNVAGGR